LVRPYQELLSRLRTQLAQLGIVHKRGRLEIPKPSLVWVGNKTILRNYMDYARVLRRDPEKLLMFLAKALATAASIDGERAIFIGRKDEQSISAVINRYVNDFVICPVCRAPDTRLERVERVYNIVCEACGARSVARGQ
jgi:translation initiation factor 2 subunit 2